MSRISERRRELGMTQKQLAAEIGVDTVSVSRYENDDRKLNLILLRKIAKALRCPVSSLLDEDDIGANPAEVSAVPEFDIRAAAGGGAVNETEQAVDFWMFSPTQLDHYGIRGRDVAMIRVTGDSMEPSLRSGSRVIIDRSDTDISTPGIFCVWDGYGLVIKRVEREFGSNPSRVRVMSDNSQHSAYSVPEEDLRVIGRAALEIRRL
ncbi:XRE family transcriptional regulator [Marinicauda sp. Alg238-R41]|uniref:XRE family transcriptional regulator n=1 Tax=Marinicauda sp. Alg238-R41 TaxID=2993447 RepID=UPI0022E86DF0|nr:LexA family transcriptional regulator [Marinicauda sp. Alg238-R41]